MIKRISTRWACAATAVAAALVLPAIVWWQGEPRPAHPRSDSTPTAANDRVRLLAASPARERDRVGPRIIANRGREIPARLTFALTEVPADEREHAVEDALEAWAASAPEAASVWAQTQSEIPRPSAIAALLRGAARRGPDTVVELVGQLGSQDPDHADELGAFLIHALTNAGAADRAAAWAANAPETNLDWITAAFSDWAAQQPETALLNAVTLPDATRRRAATEAAIGSWAKTQPQALAECATQFPPGPEKNLAMITALRAWTEEDPQAVAAWMLLHRETLAGIPRLEIVAED